MHSFSWQALSPGQSTLDLQAFWHASPWQISSLLQSASPRQMARHDVPLHSWFAPQSESTVHTGTQNSPWHWKFSSGHCLLVWHRMGSGMQETAGFGLGMKPFSHEQKA